MPLSDVEVRVLASLIEKEATVPDSYPLTLGALRLACNQATNRRPVVEYDDRTVEAALISLKSIGLVRFVHPSHGGRTIRYRQTAEDRWRLSSAEVRVLAALALRGAQTVQEVRSRVQRQLPPDVTDTVEEMLDTLAARAPEPLAVRLERRAGEREVRWCSALAELPEDTSDDEPWPEDSPTVTIPRTAGAEPIPASAATTADAAGGAPDPPAPADVRRVQARVEHLASAVEALTQRVHALERPDGPEI
ncbi:hypothetical protein BH24ACT5_BH24ACT5_13590 [soil metagenome]